MVSLDEYQSLDQPTRRPTKTDPSKSAVPPAISRTAHAATLRSWTPGARNIWSVRKAHTLLSFTPEHRERSTDLLLAPVRSSRRLLRRKRTLTRRSLRRVALLLRCGYFLPSDLFVCLLSLPLRSGRAKKRLLYNRRFVNATNMVGGKRRPKRGLTAGDLQYMPNLLITGLGQFQYYFLQALIICDAVALRVERHAGTVYRCPRSGNNDQWGRVTALAMPAQQRKAFICWALRG
ncbi:MAG: hypothetical protein BJ554DRAFT_3237 [Olpidium bornovanus]|uniref:Uncharacterized protein n=1 Tax=Olpidium bornovanus TaxID=278681 RepID=A0A8H8A0T7_9FUNG|nr:MAG: hypothetical protein BJ554DRAFT_3237 [Olpidium bornovanus]